MFSLDNISRPKKKSRVPPSQAAWYKSFLYTFFCERRRNPAFSFIGDASFRKKAGFLPRADIKNLCPGT
ncbi:Uncharacterized protein dnm_009070 [Desulfonema magnum]|uniref:Uncharacterized protein n=1 Tax=Desulfonema magnum TaxID=45655 RepID=A0A975BFQ2_9BACT|nr:Uncharacterized protein dnm_009070 [Desulfonema magnum]